MRSFLKIFTILTSKQRRICALLILLMLIIAVFEAFGIGLLYPLITIIGDSQWLEHHEKIASFLSKFGINSQRKLIFFSSLGLFFLLCIQEHTDSLAGKNADRLFPQQSA